MTFLPVVQRELHVASRRGLTYWARLLAAVIAVGLAALVASGATRLGPGTITLGLEAAAGAALFQVLTHVAFYGCLFAGILLTADSISAERREDTLGLLFLTDLKGYDVALGKLAGRSAVAVYCLLAILPVAALPLLWGGVTVGEFGRVAVVLVNTLLLSLALGLCVSSLCRERQAAITLAEVGLLFLLLGWVLPPFLLRIILKWSWDPSLSLFELASPFWLLQWAFESSAGSIHRAFLPALVVQAALTLVLLAATAWRLPHCWQARPASEGQDWLRRFWARLEFGGGAVRAARRRKFLNRNPLFWLGSRDRLAPLLMCGLTVILVGFGLLMKGVSLKGDPDLLIGSLFFFHAVVKFMVAGDAAHRFGELRRRNLLCLVWGTRLTVPEIAQGLRLCLWRLFRVPIVAALLFDLYWLCTVLPQCPPEGRGLLITQFCCVVGVFLWDLDALARVGLWFGLKVRRSANAAYLAMLQILVVPWLGGLALFALVPKSSPWALALVWAAGSGLANTVFSRVAQKNLRRHFHRLVQDRASSVPKTVDAGSAPAR